MIDVGSQFPEISLPDQDGQIVNQVSWRGHKLVVYFYPKDDTTGCTAEACGFRDSLPDIPDAMVVGVSPDNPRSHRRFADKYNLNFTLLADTDHALCQAAGVWAEKSMYGRKYMGVERTTFILDENGKIARIFTKVKPQGHAAEVQAALAEMRR